jgi:hypothetical protein
MRILLTTCTVALALGVMLPTEAAAQRRIIYPWCAFYNVVGGMTECLYFNLAQCRASVSGVGGFCYPNPAYEPPPPAPRKRIRRR